MNLFNKNKTLITMIHQQIFETIKAQLLLILPQLEQTEITVSDSLKALGANSMDRAEIIIESLRHLNLAIPMVRFGHAKNIGEIVAVMEAASVEPA